MFTWTQEPSQENEAPKKGPEQEAFILLDTEAIYL